MSGLSVVIPSKTVSNLVPCISAILENEKDQIRIIVVDDGIEYPNAEVRMFVESHATVIKGIVPFIFPRNINLGLINAGTDGCVLLNDDALLETPGGFSWMRRCQENHPQFGIISATTNIVGNPAQKPRGIGLREEPRTVAFVSVYIPRSTINQVGLMDERFGGTMPDGRRIYGFCDNDMNRRIRNAGLKIGILDDVFVDHSKLKSTFRGEPGWGGDISASMEVYRQKWGDLG